MPDDVASVAPSAQSRWAEPDWISRAADTRGWAWARVAWQRAAAQPGAWYDAPKADAIVAIWPSLFRLTEQEFSGQPFKLAFWQEVIVRLLVGWKRPYARIDPDSGETTWRHARLFRELRLWVPRKNGKSEFLAALGILFWLIEGGRGGQGFCFAKDLAQGDIVLRKMKGMISQSRRLAPLVNVFKKHLYQPETESTFVLLSGVPDGKHGRSPTVIIGDEMHEWPSQELATTLRQGTGARLEPIQLYASTAGLKTNPVGVELYEESLAILDGRMAMPATLVVIFAAEADDDIYDEATWRKANPLLGLTPSFDFMRDEAAKAKSSPRAEAHFRCYHLGIWVDAEVRWLNIRKWDACAGAKDWRGRHVREDWTGRECVGGFDVSSTEDLTALVWRFAPQKPGDKIQLAARLWMPAEKFAEREKTGRLPWRAWVDVGAIELTPGDAVDQNFVMQAILDGGNRFKVSKIGFDSWNARKLVGDLHAKGVAPEKTIEVRQGIRSMGEASKRFETQVRNGELDHGGHPVLRWMAAHCCIRFDENLNFMPAKKRSPEKIDGIVAAVIAECMAGEPPKILRADDLMDMVA
jgi:phage terminase large subunit-like protein